MDDKQKAEDDYVAASVAMSDYILKMIDYWHGQGMSDFDIRSMVMATELNPGAKAAILAALEARPA